jgi:uncharacterized coiled-coil DUF342 family protein
MSEISYTETAQSILSLDDTRVTDNVLEYVSKIVGLQEKLSNIQQDLSDIDLSLTGYRTQSKLNEINKRYQKINDEVNQVRTVMATKNLSKLDSVSDTDDRDENILDICIREEDIPDAIKRLTETLASVGQQLNSKIIAANSRLGITISVIASVIALSSVIVSLYS